MTLQKYPRSRQENLVLQELDNEIIIYDLNDNRAFCLNETSAAVWQICNGERDLTEITRLANKRLNDKINEDLVWFAIEQLKKENLVSGEIESPQQFIGKSRREVIKKIGFGTMVAIPIVASLIAPTAIQAAQSACVSDPTCTCLFSNAPANGISCGNGDGNTCNTGCTCIRNTGIGGCAIVAAMVVCPGVCS